MRGAGRGWGSKAGPGTITGVETKAEAQSGPRDSQRRHMDEGEGCAFWGGCLSRWRGLVILSTLESWIRLSSLTSQFKQLLHTHSDAERRQLIQTGASGRERETCRWLN